MWYCCMDFEIWCTALSSCSSKLCLIPSGLDSSFAPSCYNLDGIFFSNHEISQIVWFYIKCLCFFFAVQNWRSVCGKLEACRLGVLLGQWLQSGVCRCSFLPCFRRAMHWKPYYCTNFILIEWVNSFQLPKNLYKHIWQPGRYISIVVWNACVLCNSICSLFIGISSLVGEILVLKS